MYAVSEAFLTAVKQNTRRYYWTGKITTAGGAVYEFSQSDIVKGSGCISCQCCGSTEIELGTVYAAEMGISLFSETEGRIHPAARIPGRKAQRAIPRTQARRTAAHPQRKRS